MDDRDLAIRTEGLTRYYGRRCAVRGLALCVPRGSVFACIGRNGSGKSTTIRMLLGLLEPTRGRSWILGKDSRCLVPEDRARIGYLPEGHPTISWMRARELGEFQARFHPRWSWEVFEGSLRHFRIDPEARAGDLSRGERAGLALALTLAPEAALLVLDDPAEGLDPVARRSILEAMVFATRKTGRTVFFTTHILTDVERVADHVAVLDRGVLRAQAPIDAFLGRIRQYALRFTGDPPPLPRLPGLLESTVDPRELRITMVNPGEGAPPALAALGAETVEETALGFEDACFAYLRGRGGSGGPESPGGPDGRGLALVAGSRAEEGI